MLLRLLVGAGEDDVGLGVAAVGDEDLVAVQNPLVAVEHRRGAGAAGIRAGHRFGQAEGAELAPLGQRRQVGLLLLLGAELVDRVGAQRDVRRERDAGRGAHAGELLDDDGVAEIIGPGATVLFGEDHPGQTQLAELVEHQIPVEALLLVALLRRGRQLGFGEAAHHLPHHLLFIVQFENHHGLLKRNE